MKKFSPFKVVLAVVVSALFSVTGCKKEESPSAPPQKSGAAALKSAEKTSFAEVTSKLDPGGDLYAYLSTEQWLAGASRKIAAWHGLLDAIPSIKPEDRENLEKAFNLVTNLVLQSGIEDVSGVGMSSIATETNFYHAKLFLHHYPGKGSGVLWKLFGQKPHALTGLDLLPADTALAMFTDLDAPLSWSTLQKQVAQSGLPQAEEMLNKLPQTFKTFTGLEWDKVLASLGGEFGYAIILDDSKVIPIPMGSDGASVQIPEPTLVLMAKVKDDTVFNRIEQALNQYGGSQIVKVDKPGLKTRTWPLPLPLPIELRPTVAAAEGYLFISTSDAIIQEVLAVKAGKKPGLKTTDEFKRLAKDTPNEGNGFSYVGRRFGETVMKLQQQALQAQKDGTESQTALMQSLLGAGKPAVNYAVAVNTDEGWLGVANGNQHPAKFFAIAAAVPAGVLAAIAVPNFVKARSVAQKNACINNLRQIDGAKQQWALENKKKESDTPTANDLKPFLSKQQMPTCPAGGAYTINRVAEAPTCIHEGHELPK